MKTPGGILVLICASQLMLLGSSNGNLQDLVCIRPACLELAEIISEVIENSDTKEGMCGDLYNYVCKNDHKDLRKREKTGLDELWRQQQASIYLDYFEEKDHIVLKNAKRFFRGCIDLMHIEYDGLDRIKEVFKLVGGWPIVSDSVPRIEGSQTFRAHLRKLSLPHLNMLDVSISSKLFKADYRMREESENLPQVKPTLKSCDKSQSEKIAKVAKLFGADQETAESVALNITNMCSELRKNTFIGPDILDWIDALLMYVDPPQEDLSILFPLLHYLDDSIGTLMIHVHPPENIPEAGAKVDRVQQHNLKTVGNLLLWSVIWKIQDFLPTPVREIINPDSINNTNFIDREEFCFNETEKRFVPSPAAIVVDREMVSETRQKSAKEFVDELIKEYIKIVNDLESLTPAEKENITSRLSVLDVVIMRPENAFGDDLLFTYLHEKMIMPDLTFFQAIYNNYSSYYKRAIENRNFFRKYTYMWSHDITYVPDFHLLFIPAITITKHYNEALPYYINYARLGTTVLYHLGNVIRNDPQLYDKNKERVEDLFGMMLRCTRKYPHAPVPEPDDPLKDNRAFIQESVRRRLAMQFAHKLYKKWQEKNDDIILPGISNIVLYNSQRTFWFLAATAMCPHSQLPDKPGIKRIELFLTALISTPQQLKDCECATVDAISTCDVYLKKCVMYS